VTDEGIAVALTYTVNRFGGLQTDTQEALAEAHAVQSDVDDLTARVERLAATTSAPRPPPPRRDPRVIQRAAPAGLGRNWAELVREAGDNLQEQGVDVAQIDLDQLLDPQEVARLNRRHQGGFRIEANLDRYDVIVAVAAGLTAVITDALMVRIPADTKWYGGGETLEGSSLTEALRRLALDSDNWLSDWAKVPYDHIRNLPEPIPGLGGITHRVQTWGHDPLFGLVIGTGDIMRGTMTAIRRGGGTVTLDIGDPFTEGVFMAFAKQIAHLLSDVPTKSGLPLPGWLALANIEAGHFGLTQESVGGVVRRMYLNGYDSWHLLTMMTSVGASELMLRGYWGLRGSLDQDWRDSVDLEAQVAGSTATSDHPRFAAMALAAHGVAAAGNLGKIAFMGGNPLALNYPQWCAFLKSFYNWADIRMTSPGDVIDARVRANAMAIAGGWEGLDFADPDFPSPMSA